MCQEYLFIVKNNSDFNTKSSMSLDTYYLKFYKGITFHQQSNIPESIKSFSQSIVQNPFGFYAYINLSYLLIKSKSYIKAIQTCDKAIRLKPYQSVGYYNKASLSIKNQRFSQAYELIRCALSCQYLREYERTLNTNSLYQAYQHSNNNIEALKLLIIHKRLQRYPKDNILIDLKRYKNLLLTYQADFNSRSQKQVHIFKTQRQFFSLQDSLSQAKSVNTSLIIDIKNYRQQYFQLLRRNQSHFQDIQAQLIKDDLDEMNDLNDIQINIIDQSIIRHTFDSSTQFYKSDQNIVKSVNIIQVHQECLKQINNVLNIKTINSSPINGQKHLQKSQQSKECKEQNAKLNSKQNNKQNNNKNKQNKKDNKQSYKQNNKQNEYKKKPIRQNKRWIRQNKNLIQYNKKPTKNLKQQEATITLQKPSIRIKDYNLHSPPTKPLPNLSYSNISNLNLQKSTFKFLSPKDLLNNSVHKLSCSKCSNDCQYQTVNDKNCKLEIGLTQIMQFNHDNLDCMKVYCKVKLDQQVLHVTQPSKGRFPTWHDKISFNADYDNQNMLTIQLWSKAKHGHSDQLIGTVKNQFKYGKKKLQLTNNNRKTGYIHINAQKTHINIQDINQ